MAKKQPIVKFFRIRPETDKEQISLQMYHNLKEKEGVPVGKLSDSDDSTDHYLKGYLDICQHKGLLKVNSQDTDLKIEFNSEYKNLLGIGFYGEKCLLTVTDFNGNTLKKEILDISMPNSGKVKNKDISLILSEISERTTFRNMDLGGIGIAIPEEIIENNHKSPTLFSDGIKDIFGMEPHITTTAIAAAYGDRDFVDSAKGQDILYMYSDVGTGVILKKEMIFEANEYKEEKNGAYLRPWNQFSIVDTTKDLVSRGVGTEIVQMVGGNIDNITLDIVLKAAENNDELAIDLVKRSGLALGVRVAYLVNMFNVNFVLFGGGVEVDEGCFINYVKESMAKFINADALNNLKIIPGVLGKESSSIGAALMSRREIFMEV